MQIEITSEFRDICEQIVREGLSEQGWAKIESDDMFQRHYRGGFDATELSFCFSYLDDNQREYWFQLRLAEVTVIAHGQTPDIEGGLAA